MKRGKSEDEDEATSGEPSSKKSFMAIPPVNVGPVSTEVCVQLYRDLILSSFVNRKTNGVGISMLCVIVGHV